MIKHTQTIRRQQPMNCLSVFDHFVTLAGKRSQKLTEASVQSCNKLELFRIIAIEKSV